MHDIVISESIVIITQDPEHGRVLAHILSEYGYQSSNCDYDDALVTVGVVRPRLAVMGICDCRLGQELLRRLRAGYPEVRIIVLVPEGEYELGLDFLADGAADFLYKPVSERALRVSLDRALTFLDLQQENGILKEKSKILESSHQLCRQLFDEVPCYISVQNRDRRIVRANRQFKLDFGSCLGERCYEIYKHRTHPCPQCPVEETFRDGMVHQTEEVVTTRGGQQKIVLTLTAPLRDEKGEIHEVMELATDISQIRELQDRLTSLGLFIGSISHGVRGMLTALDGGLYRLEKGIKSQDLELVTNGAERVKLMISRIRNSVLEMLYYSKDRDLNIQLIDVQSFGDGVANFVEPKATKHDVRFQKEFHGQLGRFEIDPEVISAGLVNILENAVDACIEDEGKDRHIVSFLIEGGKDNVSFIIRDNGPGMDRSTQEKMFSLFFSSKGSKGTGLGLYIANDVVHQHGGQIHVDSTPGEGTEFRVVLPRKHVRAENRVNGGQNESGKSDGDG
ncbi:Signal transduction histidine kinase [Desulfomicrobium apsheronum]|uniref:histidine kinase n=1 Tax=Desulfomicrobium apsheronum TaxID=52560 RepID=A0A1I3QDX7_9BACT|nr:ATP-binding protein [Desulfomicrobium apsheronum]SFJ31571.1 Signal transduction histidine kinase [Desulfomicrobium apsheronum]